MTKKEPFDKLGAISVVVEEGVPPPPPPTLSSCVVIPRWTQLLVSTLTLAGHVYHESTYKNALRRNRMLTNLLSRKHFIPFVVLESNSAPRQRLQRRQLLSQSGSQTCKYDVGISLTLNVH